MTHITIEKAKAQRIADAFEDLKKNHGIFYVDESVDIKQALAAPVQEPVAWAGHNLDDMCEAFDRVIEEHASRKNPFHDPVNKDAMIALRILRGFVPYMKRYTTPPAAKRPWVGLTHDEYDAICDKHSAMSDFDFLEDIEAKLKEKNQ